MYSQAFLDLLQEELAVLQAKRPVLADELSRANGILMEGRLFPHDDGETASALSSDNTRSYLVNGDCSCAAAQHSQTPCKHWLSLQLYHRVSKRLRMAQAVCVVPAMLPAPEAATQKEAPVETLPAVALSTACATESGPHHPIVVAHDQSERSPQVGELMQALARAQAQMHNPGFDSTNPHFRTRYASLAAVRDAVLPPLNAEGIAVTQLPSTPVEGWVAVTTGLWHQSGQYLCTTVRLPVPKGDPQGYGTAITYARRYSLQALVTVAGDEDDDAESLRTAGAAKGK